MRDVSAAALGPGWRPRMPPAPKRCVATSLIDRTARHPTPHPGCGKGTGIRFRSRLALWPSGWFRICAGRERSLRAGEEDRGCDGSDDGDGSRDLEGEVEAAGERVRSGGWVVGVGPAHGQGGEDGEAESAT